MIDALNKEQETDDSKKEHCEEQFDVSEDEKKTIERAIGKIESAIAENKEAIAALTADIEALADGIKALDKEVEEATEQRNGAHDEFQATYAASAAAVDLFKFVEKASQQVLQPKLINATAKA